MLELQEVHKEGRETAEDLSPIASCHVGQELVQVLVVQLAKSPFGYKASHHVQPGSLHPWCTGHRNLPCFSKTLPELTFPTKVPSDSLGWIGSLKRTSDKSLFPMALGSCGHRITHQLRPINMNGRSILAVTSELDLPKPTPDDRTRAVPSLTASVYPTAGR